MADNETPDISDIDAIVPNDFNSYVGALLRSFGNSFPGFASVAQAWSEYNSVVQCERIAYLFRQFRIELDALSRAAGALQVDLFTTKEAMTLLQATIDRSKNCSSEPEIGIKARFFVYAVYADSSVPLATKETALASLDHLTEQDLSLLQIFGEKHFVQLEELEQRYRKTGTTRDDTMDLLVQSFSKLQARGIVAETWSGTPVSGSTYVGHRDAWQNRWRAKYFQLLPFGVTFYRLVFAVAPAPAPITYS